jgi:hypothetical protein
MTTREIARRLSAVEDAVARLTSHGANIREPHPVAALERIHGTFEHDEAFRQATALGRKWRRSDRRAPKSKARRK